MTRPVLRTVVGEALRRNRREQGRTLADVARAARVSRPYLSEVERGRKEASSEVIAAVCDALGIELSDLLAEVLRELVAARRAVVVPLGARPAVTGVPATAGLPVVGGRLPVVGGRPAGLGRGDIVLLAA